MKKIKITPEWILDKLSVTKYADGNGNITITTDNVSDSRWIDLALDSLNVKYKTDCVGYDPEPDQQYFEIVWEFKLDDIKDECKDIYTKLRALDESNALFQKAREHETYDTRLNS